MAIKKIGDLHPVTLHFHNDPTTMKGSKTISERINIIKNAAAIYFVSNFIKNRFLEDIKENHDNLYVLPNGIQRNDTKFPDKKIEDWKSLDRSWAILCAPSAHQDRNLARTSYSADCRKRGRRSFAARRSR